MFLANMVSLPIIFIDGKSIASGRAVQAGKFQTIKWNKISSNGLRHNSLNQDPILLAKISKERPFIFQMIPNLRLAKGGSNDLLNATNSWS